MVVVVAIEVQTQLNSVKTQHLKQYIPLSANHTLCTSIYFNKIEWKCRKSDFIVQ
jgi:hypothetical protein